jgi:hypothetical protein
MISRLVLEKQAEVPENAYFELMDINLYSHKIPLRFTFNVNKWRLWFCKCPNSAVRVVANFSVWLVLRRHTTELAEVISLFYLNVCKKYVIFLLSQKIITLFYI